MRDGTFQKSALTLLLRYTLAFLLIGLLWEAASRAAGESLLPSPVTTALLFFQSLSDPVYIGHLVVSLKRLIYGLTAGGCPRAFPGAFARTPQKGRLAGRSSGLYDLSASQDRIVARVFSFPGAR